MLQTIGRWRWRLAITLLLAASSAANERPRLLLDADALNNARSAAGLGAGASADSAAALRVHWLAAHGRFARPPVGVGTLPGELVSVAFVQAVAPTGPHASERVRWLNAQFESPAWPTTDPLEFALALDWCWNDIAPGLREDFLAAARLRTDPLDPGDSPLDGRRLRDELFGLALAATVDPNDSPRPEWRAHRARLIEAAATYADQTLPHFVALRGLAPTSPAAAADETRDAALLIELLSAALQRNLWPQYAASVGRWLEHYALVAAVHPELQYQLPHDVAAGASLRPATDYRLLRPLTAHLIAARTADPAAVHVALQFEQMLASSDDPLAANWRWTPLALPAHGLPRFDARRPPRVRSFENALLLNSAPGPDAVSVWIDAGHVHLDRRQAFDAGAFSVYSGGFQTAPGGDDIAFEATPAKGGQQQLGQTIQPFDFNQYAVAPVAHNCLAFVAPTQRHRWRGEAFLPDGGQRLFDGDCDDFAAAPAEHPRQTGQILVLGAQPDAAYVALDLASAYDEAMTTATTREFFFLGERALLVIDRFRLARSGTTAVDIVQTPTRPALDDGPLSEAEQIVGSPDAGRWQIDPNRAVGWRVGRGRTWLRVLWPPSATLHITGGPAAEQKIPAGDFAGRSYVGGSADSYERLISIDQPPAKASAWYRLGAPAQLDPLVGRRPVWGRCEIGYPRGDDPQVGVYLLLFGEAPAPQVRANPTDDERQLRIELRAADVAGCVTIPMTRVQPRRSTPDQSPDSHAGESSADQGSYSDAHLGGEVQLTQPRRLRWIVPRSVMPAEPLPTAGAGG